MHQCLPQIPLSIRIINQISLPVIRSVEGGRADKLMAIACILLNTISYLLLNQF